MSSVWLAEKFLKELEARREDTKDAMLSSRCRKYIQRTARKNTSR